MQDITDRRHHEAQEFGMMLTRDGYLLYEPIASSHYKSLHFGGRQDYEYWKKRDRAMVEKCDGVIICNMEGWADSVGVTDEIQYAISRHKEVLVCILKPETDRGYDLVPYYLLDSLS